MPTAIIADDERLMRDQLRTRLSQVWPELNIVGEAKNGEEAIELVAQLKPDFTFLDIRMPGKTGMDAARAIGNQSNIVFVTAYDQYAVEAFERGAIDYVLKPPEQERLQLTVERLKQRLEKPTEAVNESVTAMLSQLAEKMSAPKPSYLQWIPARLGRVVGGVAVGGFLCLGAEVI